MRISFNNEGIQAPRKEEITRRRGEMEHKLLEQASYHSGGSHMRRDQMVR